jgi:hypothetical protein
VTGLRRGGQPVYPSICQASDKPLWTARTSFQEPAVLLQQSLSSLSRRALSPCVEVVLPVETCQVLPTRTTTIWKLYATSLFHLFKDRNAPVHRRRQRPVAGQRPLKAKFLVHQPVCLCVAGNMGTPWPYVSPDKRCKNKNASELSLFLLLQCAHFRRVANVSTS